MMEVNDEKKVKEGEIELTKPPQIPEEPVKEQGDKLFEATSAKEYVGELSFAKMQEKLRKEKEEETADMKLKPEEVDKLGNRLILTTKKQGEYLANYLKNFETVA